MPEREREKPTLIEKIARLLIRQALGGIGESIERSLRRMIRRAGFALVGVMIAAFGVVFLAVGAVRWISLLMSPWLAWIVVGLILFLIGLGVSVLALASRRS